MNRCFRTAAALVLVLLTGAPASAQLLDRILAVVGGDVILLSDVIAARRLGLVPAPGAGMDPVRVALDALIDRQLMLAETNRYLPPDPRAEAIAARMTEIRGRFPDDAQFQSVLRETGMTLEDLRVRVRDDLRIAAYLDQRFASGFMPGEAELVKYYRAHETDFTRGGVLRPFEEVRDVARERLLAERRVDLIRDWMAGLRRRIEVTDLYLAGR